MKYLELCNFVKKNQLGKYISLLKKYTMYDKEYSLFYLEKNKILWRIKNGFAYKYIVFVNKDLEYGKRSNIKVFKSIDEASDYLWNIFIEYAQINNNVDLLTIINQKN